MRIIPCCVLMVQLAAGVAHAQTFNDLQIQLGAYNLSDRGGEKPVGVWRSTGPVIVGKPTLTTFSVGDNCEGFTVSSVRGDVGENATTAWNIEVTPLRVVRDAVTFRLRWVRFAALRQQFDQVPLESSKAFRMPNEDIELTLRPGESWPLDSVRVATGTKMIDGRTCRASASIRVSVDTYPWEEVERRLIVADLWLIERLANGKETPRSQTLSVRGVPGRPVPFYFDGIVDASVSLDIYGLLIARLESGAMAVSLETRSRWGNNGPARSVESVIQVGPEEIVEIRLPKLGDDAGPFANREFSIRIRARQLR
jgi:hypothetical protein